MRKKGAAAGRAGGRGGSRPADSVERVYAAIKELAVQYRFPPGGKLNEGLLARRLSVSRTPVREALNRLVRDGFMHFVPNRGFFARDISPDLVHDLYELRAAIEVAAVRLACQRAAADGIAALAEGWAQVAASTALAPDADAMAAGDEAFHIGIARLSGNAQFVTALDGINSQIRYFRGVDQENAARRAKTHAEHAEILACLTRRDGAGAAAVMEEHVTLSRDNAIAVTKEVIARIFLDRDSWADPVSSGSAATAPSKGRRRRSPRSAPGRR